MVKILHVCPVDKFIPPFIDLVEQHFDMEEHEFRVFGDIKSHSIKERGNVHIAGINRGKKQTIKVYLDLIIAMHKAEKIILHGLFVDRITQILWAMPWLLKKCYWVMWGGDLYIHNAPVKDWRWYKNELVRKFIIKRMGHLITYIKGDYELAKKWYGARGEYHHCLMYSSNVYEEYSLPLKQGETINILVGNSADPTNNHAGIFEKLLPYKNQKIQIFCPLSYGTMEYAEQIANLGKALFGTKFTPLLDFMPFDKYLELLGQIDIAVFAHKRQQAMGNTITLLGLGKKVYMRNDVTPWDLFSKLGLSVFDVRQFNIVSMSSDEVESNKEIILEYFSISQLIGQWEEIFG